MDDHRDAALDLQAMPASPDVHPSATASPVAAPAIPATSVVGQAAPTAFAGSTVPAGEPHTTPGTTSSRSGPRRWLAGVAAISMLSAAISSAATVAVLAPRGSAATDSAVPAVTTSGGSTTTDGTGSIVTVAEIASPAVVTITTTSAASSRFGANGVTATGVGSGFVFDAAGLILTNAHVIENSDSLTVTFGDGREVPGTVVATDTVHDLAVVRIDAAGLPVISIDGSGDLQVGELVVAIGSPLGAFTESVTSGILSATGRTIDVADSSGRGSTTMHGLLQTDAAINPGNSGGPLLDAAGRAIGVNVAVATTAQGIGFAVPITDAAAIMAEARATVAGAA